MKLVICLIVCLFKLYISTDSENQSNFENHFSMMMKMKMKTRALLQNLYTTANKIESSEKDIKSKQEENFFTFLQNGMKRRASTENKKSLLVSHISRLSKEMIRRYKNNKEKYIQYRYLNYHEIEAELHKLAEKYPSYLRLTTGQKLYDLPHPGGYCKSEQDKKG